MSEDYEYRYFFHDGWGGRVDAYINSLVQEGWEPVGEIPLFPSGISRHKEPLLVFMRRPKRQAGSGGRAPDCAGN